MQHSKIQKILSDADKTVSESKDVISLYQEEMVNEQILQTLSGIAKNIGINAKSIASTIGGHVVGFAKGALQVARAMFPDILGDLMNEWRVSKDAMERAKNAGVPEGLLAAPCAWWVTDLAQAGMEVEDGVVILDMYDQGKGSEEFKQLKKELMSRLEEGADRMVTSSIISEWLPISEGIRDYQDKEIPNWLMLSTEKSLGEWQTALEEARISLENLARLVISTQLKGRDEKDDPLLAAVFSDDPSEKQEEFRQKIKDNAEKLIDAIMGIHANIIAKGKEAGIRSRIPVGRFSTKLSPLYPDGKKSIERWRDNHKEKEKDFHDLAALVEFVRTESGEESEDEGSKEFIFTDLTPRQMLLKVFTEPSWYRQVDAKIGANQEQRINQLVATAQKSLGDELAKAQGMERLSDLTTASPEIKKSFDTFTKADPELKQYIEYAMQNNDEEIGSRLIAMFRPVFTTAFIDFLKKDFEFGGPKLMTLISQAEQAGYKRDEDPMWERWVTMVEGKKQELIAGFDSGLSTLESQAKTAEREIGQIMQAKAEEEEEATPDVDVEV